MGREVNRLGFLREKYMLDETRKILDSLNIKIKSLDIPVENYSGGQRQAVAIGRSVYFNARILIMDEPTAALGVEETEMVVNLVGELKKKGIGIFFISHDMHDVIKFTDRIAVLKNGKLVDVCDTRDVSEDDVVQMIISGIPMSRT